MSDTDDLRAASRALKDAISGLSRALGQGLADVGTDLGREIATELNAATAELTRELSGAAAAVGERRAGRSAKAEQTRADLLAAAAKVFAERGYEAASVADLAKEAGYTKGALYSHFASKEELFLALVAELNGTGEGRAEGSATPLDEPLPVTSDLGDVLLSLEAYLYALRNPAARGRVVPLAESSLRTLAARVRFARTGEAGEPTRDDVEVAMGLSALCLAGGIWERILPPEWDVRGAFDRLGGRLTGGAATS